MQKILDLLTDPFIVELGEIPFCTLQIHFMELITLTGKNGAALRTAAKTNQKTLEQRIDGLEEQQQILFILVSLVTALTLLT